MEEKPKAQKTTLHILKLVIVAIMCFAVLAFVFGVGIFVGQQRAAFSFRWAENYHRNFGGPSRGIFGNFPDRDFTAGHGIFGQVLSIDGNNLIVKGQDGLEKTVVALPTTIVVNSAGAAKLPDIKINDTIVVIGAPDSQGRVQAKLIRIFPPGTSFFGQRNAINS